MGNFSFPFLKAGPALLVLAAGGQDSLILGLLAGDRIENLQRFFIIISEGKLSGPVQNRYKFRFRAV